MRDKLHIIVWLVITIFLPWPACEPDEDELGRYLVYICLSNCDRCATGFFILPRVVVTCDHLIRKRDDDSDIYFYLGPGQRHKQRGAEVIAEHGGKDLALIRVNYTSEYWLYPCVDVDVGDSVLMTSYKRGDLQEYHGVVERIDQINDAVYMRGWIQTTLYNEPGYSGSPILDDEFLCVKGVNANWDRYGNEIGPGVELLRELMDEYLQQGEN